jgi:hypothetical protein
MPSASQTLYLYVESRTVGLSTEAAGGIDGYHELRLPSPQTVTGVLLSFPQTIPVRELRERRAAGSRFQRRLHD